MTSLLKLLYINVTTESTFHIMSLDLDLKVLTDFESFLPAHPYPQSTCAIHKTRVLI